MAAAEVVVDVRQSISLKACEEDVVEIFVAASSGFP